MNKKLLITISIVIVFLAIFLLKDLFLNRDIAEAPNIGLQGVVAEVGSHRLTYGEFKKKVSDLKKNYRGAKQADRYKISFQYKNG